jgi:cellulose synthase/poly-beta-1,6-N-acetylglucosamine synthase-like glycosyltransferase
MAGKVFWIAIAFIVFTDGLYPLLIAAWARLRPRPVARRAGHAPQLSVVLAVHNEEARLVARLDNLLAQQYPPERLEILVVSDGSTDRTANILEEFARGEPRVRPIVLADHRGKAGALNAGVAAARGELVAFADARQRFAPDALARLAENFADPAVGSASGELVLQGGGPGVAADVGLYWRYEKWIRRNESAAGSMLGATGAIYAVRRALWRPLPPGTLLDDFLAPLRIVRAGWRAVFDARAAALDQPSRRAADEFRRKARTLAGNWQAFGIEPAMLVPWLNSATWFQVWCHKLFRLLVPWALLAAAAASLIAPGAVYTLAVVAQAAFYGAAGVGWALERRGTTVAWRLPSLAWTFVVLNAAAVVGLGFWLGGIDARQMWRGAPRQGSSTE